MTGPRHLCVLYVATGGLQGLLMGSDEQEIVLLIYVIINVAENKVSRRLVAVYNRIFRFRGSEGQKLDLLFLR